MNLPVILSHILFNYDDIRAQMIIKAGSIQIDREKSFRYGFEAPVNIANFR
jgi:hypothetical protein